MLVLSAHNYNKIFTHSTRVLAVFIALQRLQSVQRIVTEFQMNINGRYLWNLLHGNPDTFCNLACACHTHRHVNVNFHLNATRGPCHASHCTLTTNTKQKKPVMHTDNKPKQTTMKKNENKSPQVKNPRRRTALMIGISLVLMALIAGFAATTIGQIFVVGNANALNQIRKTHFLTGSPVVSIALWRPTLLTFSSKDFALVS